MMINSNIKNYYKILSKTDTNTLSNFNKLFVKNFKKIKYNKITISKKTKIYNTLNNYLLDNKYYFDFNNLFNCLKLLKENDDISYKEIYNIPNILNNIIVDKIIELEEIEFNKYQENNKINKAFLEIKKKKDVSINKYYKINENTSDYVYYQIYKKITSFNSARLYKSFLIILELYNKKIDKIIKQVEFDDANYIYYINNIYDCLDKVNNIDMERLFKLSNIESLLTKDNIYNNMSLLTKNIYRNKLMSKLDPYRIVNNSLNENKHIGYYLFNNSSFKYMMNYNYIDDNSKVLVVINNCVKKYSDIDYLIKLISNNTISNLYFYISIDKGYEYVNYYKNKLNDISKNNILEELDSYKLDELDIKYTVNITNGAYLKKEYIMYLYNIMEHPLNEPIVINNESVRKGFAILEWDNKNYIYNNRVYSLISEKTLEKSNIIKDRLLNKKYIQLNINIDKKELTKTNINTINEDLCDINILTNNYYSIIFNKDKSYSRYKNMIINKNNSHNYINILSNNVNILYPYNDNYEIQFNNNVINYSINKDNLKVLTSITVSSIDNIEIIKISIKNNSLEDKKYDIYTYLELDNSLRPTFKDGNIIVKKNGKIIVYKLLNVDVLDYKTNKLNINNINKLISYNNTEYKELFYPVVSFKTDIFLKSNEEKHFYILTYITNKNVYEKDNSKYDVSYCNKIFNINYNTINKNNFIYNELINKLYNPIIDKNKNTLLNYNSLDINNLTKYGININKNTNSILVEVDSNTKLEFVKDIINFYVYCKKSNYYINIIFLVKDSKYIKKIEGLKFLLVSNKELDITRGKIIILNRNNILNKLVILLYLNSTYIIDSSKYLNIKDFLKALKIDKNTHDNIELLSDDINNFDTEYDLIDDNMFYNEYGYFTKDGLEYSIIDFDTPTPWKNILTGKNLKTYISNTNIYTKYKKDYLTVYNSQSEKFKINDKDIIYNNIIHGLGYSIFNASSKKINIRIKQVLSLSEDVKIYKFSIYNKTSDDINFRLTYELKPKLYLDKYIIDEFDNMKNIITLDNNSDKLMFVTSTLKIDNYNNDDLYSKKINININLNKSENKEFAVILGYDTSDNIRFLRERYSNMSSIDTTIKISEKTIYSDIYKININTNYRSFDYLINYWLPYQIINNIDNMKINELVSVINPLKDNISYSLNKYNKVDYNYITSLYNYIDITNDNSILNKDIYTKIKEFIDKSNTISFSALDAIDSFIKITKLYNKNFDTKNYKNKLDIIYNNLRNTTDTSFDYKAELLIHNLISDKDRLLIKDNLKTENYNDKILYLKVLYILKEYDLLYKEFQNINPINKTKDKDDALIYAKEPYLVNNNYAYLYEIAIKYILGIKIVGDKLYIKPHIPNNIRINDITYKYVNTIYKISIDLDAKHNYITIDDYIEEVNYIKLKNDLKIHYVKISIKKTHSN